MPPLTSRPTAAARPILRTFDETENGYRFRFTYGPKFLILDADQEGRLLDCHLEWPPEFAVPPLAREAAIEQVRRVLLTRRVPR